MNGVNIFAHDLMKEQYLTACQKMTFDQLFAELMRVHALSAQLLQDAQAEIMHLNDMLIEHDDFNDFDSH